MKFDTVSVIGLGYIGLPTAATFASCGMKVIGVDVSEEVVSTINRGEIHIIEPGLAEIVSDAVRNGRLKATLTPEASDAFLISVPTPFNQLALSDPEPDLSYIKNACEAIAPLLRRGNLVILESTSPVGTTELVAKWLAGFRKDLRFPGSGRGEHDVFVAHCPERVMPGNVIDELINNDRVIGGISEKCSQVARDLYAAFVKGVCHITSAKTAELSKLAENASRDAQIAFANELSIVSDECEVNVWELIELCNKHPRVNILQPGAGVGGHCIAVDPWFIISARESQTKFMRAARLTNLYKEEWVVEKVKSYLVSRDCKRVIIFGAAFKEDIDDFRESPSLRIAEKLRSDLEIDLLILEPNCNEDNINGIKVITLEEVDYQNDLCVLLLAHKEFRALEKPHHLIDIKGLWSR